MRATQTTREAVDEWHQLMEQRVGCTGAAPLPWAGEGGWRVSGDLAAMPEYARLSSASQPIGEVEAPGRRRRLAYWADEYELGVQSIAYTGYKRGARFSRAQYQLQSSSQSK